MKQDKYLPAAAIGALIAVLGLMAPFARARVESEIAPTDKRAVSVEKAIALSKQTKAAPLPDSLSQPFAPPGFDLTDAEEAAAAAMASRLANPGGPAVTLESDHQLLQEIVSKVRPSGSSYFGGKPLLIFGKRFVKIGAHFTVTYKSSDYDLELTQVEGSNFTLRYKNEEITRPIQAAQPAKSP